MSASPMARQVTDCQVIPKRVVISDPLDMPADYSSTPGGTLYSTTPGGTKIVYERSFLINLRNSPISKTPPQWDLPENIMKGSKSPPNKPQNHQAKKHQKRRSPLISVNDDDQFQMDM